MTLAVSPINDNLDGAETAGGEAQRVFVRVIAAQPGAPWDQSRQAALEARLGAPVRLTEVVYRLRRIDRWRRGEPARFAAVYARTEDARRGLVATPTVDGRQLTIDFSPPARQARRLRAPALAAGAIGVAIVLVAGLAHEVGVRRTAFADQLEAVEGVAAVQGRQAGDVLSAKREARALEAEGVRGRRIADVLTDVAWVARAKAPLARIEAVHWDHGFLAVEAGGEGPPFRSSERTLEKARKPVRSGVWLWGVGSIEPWRSISGMGRAAPNGRRR